MSNVLFIHYSKVSFPQIKNLDIVGHFTFFKEEKEC